MRGPILSSVSSQREVLDIVTVNTIVQSEEDAKACLYENRMRCLESNVISRDISDGLRQSVRRQEFLDGEMRKLDDPRIPVFDYDDQTRASRHHCFFLILKTAGQIQLRDPLRFKVKSQDFCKFLDSKWANSRDQTLQQSMSVSLV